MEDRIKIGTDPETGLDVYRELDYFIGGIRENIIQIFYYEYFLSPNGTKLEAKQKRAFVIDIPAVTRKGDPILISEAVMDNDQDPPVEISPAVYNADVPDVIVTPENLGYTKWRDKKITSDLLNARLGEDIIIGSMKNALASLPIGIVTDAVING